MVVDFSKCPRRNLVSSLLVDFLRFSEAFSNKKMGLDNIGNCKIYSIVLPLERA